MTDRLAQLDVLARQAAGDLEAATEVDPARGLGQVYAAHTRHRTRTRVAVAAVLVAALSAGWFGRGAVTGDRAEPAVGPTPAPTVTQATPIPHLEQPALCDRSGITCLGHRAYRFALADAVRWQIPRRFGVASGAGITTNLVESYWTHRDNRAGVSVLEAIEPAGLDGGAAPGFAKGATAHAFARWLATQPFLDATAPVPTTVGGNPAWRVRARLAPGVGPPPGTCSGSTPCYPVTFGAGEQVTGIWEDMVADYTFVSLPSGTALVWSWAFGDDTRALAVNRHAVDGITWPAH
jgi:hypothetical protein